MPLSLNVPLHMQKPMKNEDATDTVSRDACEISVPLGPREHVARLSHCNLFPCISSSFSQLDKPTMDRAGLYYCNRIDHLLIINHL